jgi:hypothetical protein
MASPLPTAKQTVDLTRGSIRVSRIRRDPPPKPVKKLSIRERNERDTRLAIIGIVVFALALFAVLVGFSSWDGWSPAQYTVDIEV